MKISQVVIMAIALSAAVPSAMCRSWSRTKFSLQELALLKEITEIGDKFSEYWIKNGKCIDKIISQSDVKDAWADVKPKIDDLVHVQWKKCDEIEDIATRQKSKVRVVENGVDAIKGLVSKLISETKTDLVESIVKSECWGYPEFFGDLEHLESFTVPNKFQCLVNVVGNVSESNRLGNLWSKIKPDLQQHLDMRRTCNIDDGQIKTSHLCNLKEGIITYKLLNDYLHLAAVKKPQIIDKLACGIEQGCDGYQFIFFVEAHEAGNAEKIIDILKCHSEAVSQAVDMTYSEERWNSYKKHLKTVFETIRACENEADNWEATKCVAKEAQHASDRIGEFMLDLDDDINRDGPYFLYKTSSTGLTNQRVKDMMQEKCHPEKKNFLLSLFG